MPAAALSGSRYFWQAFALVAPAAGFASLLLLKCLLSDSSSPDTEYTVQVLFRYCAPVLLFVTGVQALPFVQNYFRLAIAGLSCCLVCPGVILLFFSVQMLPFWLGLMGLSWGLLASCWLEV